MQFCVYDIYRRLPLRAPGAWCAWRATFNIEFATCMKLNVKVDGVQLLVEDNCFTKSKTSIQIYALDLTIMTETYLLAGKSVYEDNWNMHAVVSLSGFNRSFSCARLPNDTKSVVLKVVPGALNSPRVCCGFLQCGQPFFAVVLAQPRISFLQPKLLT